MNKIAHTSFIKTQSKVNEKIRKLLSKPDFQQLVRKFDCILIDILDNNVSIPFEDKQFFADQIEAIKFQNKFSFFKNGITNIHPYKDVTVSQLYEVIAKGYLAKKTELLRTTKETDLKKFKKLKSNLPYVTFSGTFKLRNNDSLIKHSGLYCMDIDNVSEPDKLKNSISGIEDQYFETELIFTSPSGQGLKWVIYLPPNNYSHRENFLGIRNYVKDRYKITVDNTPDVARACFICHDPECYINPRLL